MNRAEQMRRRLTRGLARHGLWGSLRLLARLIYTPWTLDKAERRARKHRQRLEREFDRRFGVDTIGKIPLSALTVDSDNVRHGGRYGATRQDLFQEMFAQLPIDYTDKVFIDFGSGKGKALLLASELPFRRIIGVEFARELHEVAAVNIRRYRSASQKCHAVESVCLDAAAFAIPDEPLVCYFFAPFGAAVMRQVLANLRQSLEAHPRELYVIYHNPLEAQLMDESDFLVRIATGAYYVIYQSRCSVMATAA